MPTITGVVEIVSVRGRDAIIQKDSFVGVRWALPTRLSNRKSAGELRMASRQLVFEEEFLQTRDRHFAQSIRMANLYSDCNPYNDLYKSLV